MAKRSATLIAALSAGNFVIGMGAFVVIGMLAPVSEGLSVTPADAGLLLTIYALAYALGSPLGVAFTGALERRHVLLGGLGLFALAALLATLATSLEVLLIARVFGALGAGLFTPVAAGVALAVSAPGAEGRTLARVFFGLTLAQVTGVPAGSWLAYAFGWQAAFAVVVVLAVMAWIALWNLVPRGIAFQVNGLGTLRRALLDIPGMVAVLFTATFLGAIYIMLTYLALLLDERMGLGRDGVTLVLVVYGLGAVIGNLLGGRLNDRIGSYRTLVVLCVVQLCCLPLFSYLPVPLALLLLLVFVSAVFGWAFMAPQQARLVGLRPARQAVVLSLNAAAIYVGTAVGSSLGSLALAGLGLDALGWCAGLAMLGTLAHLLASRRIQPESA